MRLKLTLSTALAALTLGLNAQTADSVDMGTGYQNDVYYSFDNREVKKSQNNTWDLAFRTGFRTDGIFINSVSNANPGQNHSVKLFLYPNSNISGWSSFDTAGRMNWIEYQNNDTSWEFGAFNRAAVGHPDYSWGVYDQTTHIINGDSIYMLEITNGANVIYKKIYIINKELGKWRFRIANIDGTDDHTDSVQASNANAKLLDYYDVLNKTWVNREPDSLKDWDLLFTRYHEWLGNSYYPVMGVLSNKDVTVAQAKPVNTATFDFTTLTAADYKYEKDVIGSDWKQYDQGNNVWNIEDSTLYFVKAKTGAIWKMEFTGFTGSGNRIVYFNKTKMSPGLSVNPVATVKTFGVFPNPASTNISLVFENADNSVSNTLKIFNMAGKMIESHSLESAPGFYANSLNIAHLPAGVYIVTIENGGYTLSQKLIKQ